MRALRGTERKEWVNTDQVQWNQDVAILDDMWEMRDKLRTYQPGEHTEAGYFGGIVRPYVATGYWVPYRTAGYAQINIPGWADGLDPDHTGAFDTYAENAPVSAAHRRLHRRRARSRRARTRAPTCTTSPTARATGKS